MNQAKKTYLFLTVSTLISFCLVAFITFFLLIEIKKSSSEIPIQKQNTAYLESKINDLGKFNIFYKDITLNLEKINNFFIDPEMPVDFISFLEKTSQDCKILMKQPIVSTSKGEKDLWPSLFFQLYLTGSPQNLLKFIDKLETSLYLIDFQGLNISKLTEEDLKSQEVKVFTENDVSATLSIKVYNK